MNWHIDSVSGHPLPVLIVRGWCDDPADFVVELEYTDGRRGAPFLFCREARADVVAALHLTFPYPGFVAEFHLSGHPAAVWIAGRPVKVSAPELYGVATPHYHELLTTDAVWHREHIYGSGPPQDASPIVEALAAALLGPTILDFGCGNGDLLVKLRARGHQVSGIEIDRPAIRDHLKAGAGPFINLYDGALPLPYESGAFDSVIATEVIEHVDKPQDVVRELMRVCRSSIFVTVPDASSIPFSWPLGMVPWHLLEGTHVNFFNARSLAGLFAPDFVPAKHFRTNNLEPGGHFIPGSIAILFRRMAALRASESPGDPARLSPW